MGRTLRERSRRNESAINLASDPSFIRLTRWMREKGWKEASMLRLSNFAETGRGLMARNYIKRGDVLVSIPKNLLITTATACDSTIGRILSKLHLEHENFLCQEVMASFLVWERHLGDASDWINYIETLPMTFSTPHGLDKHHFGSFPWFLQEKAVSALLEVQNYFLHLVGIFKNVVCDHCQLSGSEIFTWDSFLWGWCCVNTRAVFLEPDNIPFHTLNIKDRDCLALAPYLDMFNHSDTAQVTVCLNSTNNCYEIVTQLPVKKYKEVFINYGPHSNVKLFTEYGFIVPVNLHDTIPLKFSDLIDACKFVQLNIQYEYEKVKFCQKHNLISHLVISSSGLSWNTLILLKILLSDSGNAKVWENISFMGSDNLLSDCHSAFYNVRKKIISIMTKTLITSQNLLFQKCMYHCCLHLKEGTKNTILEICWVLLDQLKAILEVADGEEIVL